MALRSNQFIAPSGDICDFELNDEKAWIMNMNKRMRSSVTFDQAEQAAKDYPEPQGWPLVLRAIRQKQARERS